MSEIRSQSRCHKFSKGISISAALCNLNKFEAIYPAAWWTTKRNGSDYLDSRFKKKMRVWYTAYA